MSKRNGNLNRDWSWNPQDGDLPDTTKSRREKFLSPKKRKGKSKRKQKRYRGPSNKPSDGFYKSWEWAKLRYKVLAYYGPTCMLCGATKDDTRIVVDHIYPRRTHPKLELDFNNMQVLCDWCNRGKSYTGTDDFRPVGEPLPEDGADHMKAITGKTH